MHYIHKHWVPPFMAKHNEQQSKCVWRTYLFMIIIIIASMQTKYGSAHHKWDKANNFITSLRKMDSAPSWWNPELQRIQYCYSNTLQWWKSVYYYAATMTMDDQACFWPKYSRRISTTMVKVFCKEGKQMITIYIHTHDQLTLIRWKFTHWA